MFDENSNSYKIQNANSSQPEFLEGHFICTFFIWTTRLLLKLEHSDTFAKIHNEIE